MAETSDSGGILQSVGEVLGGFLSAIPPAIGSFFAGIGRGANVEGFLDWIALAFGLALLIGAIRGLMRGRIVGPLVSGAIAVVLMGWAVSQ